MSRFTTLLGIAGLAASFLWAAAPSPAQERRDGVRGNDRAAPGLTGSVQGRIFADAASGGQSLSYALVELQSASGTRSVLADGEGRFQLPDLAPGAATLRAHYLGHRARTLELLVPPGRALHVDVELAPEAVVIPGLVVRGAPLRLPDPDGPGPLRPVTAGADVELVIMQVTPGLAELAIGPGADGRQPGDGRDPADPQQVLLMRGSTADLKLVLLDGAPVYTPFHLGGLVESFDAAILGQADHHVGGAPARYDGGLSYILDLETRRPASGSSFRGAVDMLSASGSGHTRLGPFSLLASTRVLHNGGPRVLEGAPSPYGYRDGLVRASLPFGASDAELAITAFGNREEVRLGSELAPLAPEAARWGNALVSTRLRHRLGDTDLSWTAAASRYDAELPLRANNETPTNPVLARGETGRLRLALDASRPLGSGDLRFGGSLDDMDVHYASRLITRDGVVRTDAHSRGQVVGVHAEVQRPLGPMVVGRVGARVDHFDPGGLRSALRGSVAWSVTEDAVLTVAAGRYHQLSRASDPDLEGALMPEIGADDAPIALDLELAPFLAVATADHLVLGMDQRLGDWVELGTRGFVKRFQGVGGADEHLTSSGVDLRLQAAGAGRTGWLGYALAWSWQGNEPGFSERFTGRHLLTAGYRGPVSGPVGIEARVAFSDGLPYTEVPLGTADEAGRAYVETINGVTEDQPALAGDADGFLRLDLELYGEWDAPLTGGRGRIRPYVRLMNALDRRDALFYYFEPWRDQSLQPLAERPVLPVVGVAWSF